MESAEIARRFLAYFEQQGHTIVPSAPWSPTIPRCCSSSPGMQPFKPYLLGQQTPPYRRVADVQKCVRTLDIEEVGKTTRHATFFQMLGNWSFGDYFKEGAIRFAWELLTRSEADGGFGFPESKLWATVLHGDDEAYAIWRDEIGLPESRIQPAAWPTTTGTWACPGPAARARRSTTTAAPSTAATAARRRTRTASWRSGTWSSCRTS
jgi:alanyl-tRNA synthetase